MFFFFRALELCFAPGHLNIRVGFRLPTSFFVSRALEELGTDVCPPVPGFPAQTGDGGSRKLSYSLVNGNWGQVNIFGNFCWCGVRGRQDGTASRAVLSWGTTYNALECFAKSALGFVAE